MNCRIAGRMSNENSEPHEVIDVFFEFMKNIEVLLLSRSTNKTPTALNLANGVNIISSFSLRVVENLSFFSK